MANRNLSGDLGDNPYNTELQTRHRLQDVQHLQYLQLLFGVTRDTLLRYPGSESYCRYIEASLEPLLGDDYHEVWQVLNLPRPRTAHDCWPWLIDVLKSIKSNTKRPEDISIDSVLESLLERTGAATPSNKTFPQIAIFAVLCWATMILTPTLRFANQPQLACKLPGRSEAEGGAQHKLDKCKRAVSVAFRGFKTEAWGPLVMSCGQPNFGESEDLYEASLCYKSLQTFSKISIQWVTTMTAHLEFDPASRQLSLFRFPTICALKTIQQKPTSSVLDSISQDFDPLPAEDIIHRFVTLEQEILLSYRLLFAQSAGSRKAAHRELARLKLDGLPFDKLLSLLCEHKYRKGSLFWARIDKGLRGLPSAAWPVSCRDSEQHLQERDVYCAREDFPRLGRRLIAIQKFNLRQRPSKLTDLWRDRRNPLQWYTFWAVLIIGGFANLVAVLQLAVAVCQVVPCI